MLTITFYLFILLILTLSTPYNTSNVNIDNIYYIGLILISYINVLINYKDITFERYNQITIPLIYLINLKLINLWFKNIFPIILILIIIMQLKDIYQLTNLSLSITYLSILSNKIFPRGISTKKYQVLTNLITIIGIIPIILLKEITVLITAIYLITIPLLITIKNEFIK